MAAQVVRDDWWMDYARCKGLDVEIFYPKRPKRGGVRDYNRARKICAKCPVRTYCLWYAIAHKIRDGVWGGRNEHERQKLPREWKVRIRRVWREKQLDIQLRGGEKLGERDRSVHRVPNRRRASGTSGD